MEIKKDKLIFLDFDGVLNSVSQSIGLQQLGSKPYYAASLNPEGIGLVKWVCAMTGAKIVISSSWRIGGYAGNTSVQWFQGLFEGYGWLHPPIVGTTPVLRSGFRGSEIEQYISEVHPDGTEAYVIVDDSADFFEYQPLVRTNPVYGLTLKEAMQMVRILGVLPDKEQEVAQIQIHLDFEFDVSFRDLRGNVKLTD